MAIIQNSPLYKGIPGLEGTPGNPGLRGVRGIKFLFVKLTNFQNQFPNELSSLSQIDINYINTKLLTFTNKTKLLLALDITELVDKDIIVLGNTIMLSYDLIDNNFVNTNISFNEQSNLLNNIQQQIEDYVQYYISINQTINNLSNVFEGYSTLAKNYSDNNNTFITSTLTNSSVFSPYIPGFNSNIGLLQDTHKHFGFSDSQFPLSNNGTMVFGSMKKYYQLLINTIAVDTTQSLSSDYSPGVGNIPSAVFLQDTEKAGLLIGYKGKQNLKRFGSIFKNDINELIIKSDSGINPSEYSELKLHRTYMKYDKLAQFGDDLEVSRDALFFADISNKFIKSGKFTENANSGNNFNPEVLELGRKSDSNVTNTIVRNVADIEMYKNYINNVLITDINGIVSKAYSLETTPLNNTLLSNLQLISETINSPNKILTSYYYGYLARKINAISNFVDGNYWRKDQYDTGEIPDLYLSNSLYVERDFSLGDGLIEGFTQLPTGIKELNLNTPKIKYNYFTKKVLITDSTGFVSNSYQLEENVLNLAELAFGVPLNIFNESSFNILSTKYYAHLAKKINGIAVGLANNYWTKADFESGIIPSLYLNTGLLVTGGVSIIPNGNTVFNVNPITGQLTLGNATYGNTTINSYYVVLSQFVGNILYVNPDGTLSHDYTLELNNFNEPEVFDNIQISDIVANPTNTSIARGYHVRWLGRKINNLMTWLTDNIWYKPQWLTGEIPTLITNTNLETNGSFRSGDINNPNIQSINDFTKIGKNGGQTEIDGESIKLNNRPSIVVVTDNNGEILSDYSIETDYPNSGPGTGGQLETEIFADFWVKANQPQPFLNTPILPTKIVTSFYINWIVQHLKAIRTLIFDRPTYPEVESMIGGAFPLGGIVFWNNAFGTVPTGWVVCDGRYIPGIPQRTPNILDKYIKGSLNPNIISGNINHLVSLTAENNGPHVHYVNPHTHPFNDWYYAENVGQNWGLAGSDEGVDSDNAPFGYDKTTGSGGGSNTQSSGTGTPFNIEPRNITLIPIMKFWNGVGTIPTTILPPFANILTVTNNSTDLIVGMTLSFADNTVTNYEVQGTLDNGITWNTLRTVNSALTTLTNINISNTGDWKFRLLALNGDSSFTTGQYSNEFSLPIYIGFMKIIDSTLDINNVLNVTLNIQLMNPSVTEITLQRKLSTDSTFTDISTITLLPGQTTINDIHPNGNEGETYNYRIKANNGTVLTSPSITDEYSNIESVTLLQIFVPNFFDKIVSLDVFEYNGSNGGGSFIGTQFDFNVNRNDLTVTSVRVQVSFNNGATWSTLQTSITNSNFISFTKNSWPNPGGITLFRLYALNGSSITQVSNEFSVDLTI